MATEAKKNKTIPAVVELRIGEAVDAYALISKLKLGGVAMEAARKVLKASGVLRNITRDFEAFEKDASERLKPDGWDDVVKKARDFEQLTEEERREVNRAGLAYDRAVAEVTAPERDRKVKTEQWPRLTADEFDTLVAANMELSVAQLLAVRDYLC